MFEMWVAPAAASDRERGEHGPWAGDDLVVFARSSDESVRRRGTQAARRGPWCRCSAFRGRSPFRRSGRDALARAARAAPGAATARPEAQSRERPVEAYAPSVPGFFLYFPSRAQRSSALQAFVALARATRRGSLGRPAQAGRMPELRPNGRTL